jgi:hypothetical protein
MHYHKEGACSGDMCFRVSGCGIMIRVMDEAHAEHAPKKVTNRDRTPLVRNNMVVGKKESWAKSKVFTPRSTGTRLTSGPALKPKLAQVSNSEISIVPEILAN